MGGSWKGKRYTVSALLVPFISHRRYLRYLFDDRLLHGDPLLANDHPAPGQVLLLLLLLLLGHGLRGHQEQAKGQGELERVLSKDVH